MYKGVSYSYFSMTEVTFSIDQNNLDIPMKKYVVGNVFYISRPTVPGPGMIHPPKL